MVTAGYNAGVLGRPTRRLPHSERMSMRLPHEESAGVMLSGPPGGDASAGSAVNAGPDNRTSATTRRRAMDNPKPYYQSDHYAFSVPLKIAGKGTFTVKAVVQDSAGNVAAMEKVVTR